MTEYPHSLAIERMQEFFKDLPTKGTPDKVTLKTLEGRGFKSKADRAIVPTLRFLSLTDDAGTPTQEWQSLRDQNKYGRTMTQLVRQAYADVFKEFEDANLRSDRKIHNFLNTRTKADQTVVAAMTGVFKMLCSLADFQSELVQFEDTAETQETAPSQVEPEAQQNIALPASVTRKIQSDAVTFHLHFHLPENVGKEQIELVFQGMKTLLTHDEDDAGV